MFLRRNNISINHRFMRRSCICKGVVKGQLGKLVDVPSVRQYIYWWLIADCCYINWLIRLWLIVHCYLVSISLYIQCNRTYLKLLEMIVTGSDCRNDFPWWCDWLWGFGTEWSCGGPCHRRSTSQPQTDIISLGINASNSFIHKT
jgi:hypothetical protein